MTYVFSSMTYVCLLLHVHLNIHSWYKIECRATQDRLSLGHFSRLSGYDPESDDPRFTFLFRKNRGCFVGVSCFRKRESGSSVCRSTCRGQQRECEDNQANYNREYTRPVTCHASPTTQCCACKRLVAAFFGRIISLSRRARLLRERKRALEGRGTMAWLLCTFFITW